MTTPPLSSAAQAVLDAVVDGALPPFHVIARPMAAAAIRALTDLAYMDCDGRQLLCLPDLLSIAAELDGGAPQPTITETP